MKNAPLVAPLLWKMVREDPDLYKIIDINEPIPGWQCCWMELSGKQLVIVVQPCGATTVVNHHSGVVSIHASITAAVQSLTGEHWPDQSVLLGI